MPEEAAKLIIKSLEVENGKIAVLDMGEQLKIKDVVEKIIDILNVKVDIEIIGLRKGEKLEEELFYDFEKIIDKKDYIFVVEPNIYLSKDYVFSFISSFNEKLSNLSNTVELDKFVEDECLNFVNNLKIVKSF
jgi:FlaA1/EpsC-like NDP-sugar epimerase